MTTQEKIDFLDEAMIEHQITQSGELIALCKMSTFTGDDCSEWLDADEMIDCVKEHDRYFNCPPRLQGD